ncbi:hypothetical protein LTR22_007640 [Elasticomyces elasticus]|nr:hypothetical protein LTR22_007640 [Elasticomyces elasticus]KAK4906126.1 hypothetical protein LTR49_024675 [Elasticomyces elasticus]
MSPMLPPAIPPKDRRRGGPKLAPHSLESSTAVSAFTGGELISMSSAVERRRRGSLPVTRVDSTAASRSTNKPTRTRIRDLKPVHTPVPVLLPLHKLSNHSTSTEVTSSVDGDAVANMSKLQARDDIHFGTSNVGDLKQMIQSLDDEMDELEASNNMLKSTMEWDSDEGDDEVEKPALRRLFSTLKRKPAVSDRRYTMYSRSSQDPEDAASRRQSSSATYDRALSQSRLSQEEIDNNSVEFKSMFAKRMQAKAKLRVGSAIAQEPTSATTQTSKDLTPSLATTTPSIASRGDSDPFVGALVSYKPLPDLPVSSSAITLHVTSPSHNVEPSQDVVQSFIQKYPPPPDPATPTRSAGRSLRYAKSETSMRSSMIGPKLAPQIAPAKRTANVEITNPDDNPGVYIAKVAVSAGLPQSPLHPDWEAAIKAVKSSLVEDLKEADRRARDEVKLLKLSANEKKQAERLLWNEHGDRITSSAGRLERVPTVDYAAMTDHDLRMFRVALQRETEPSKPTGVVKRLLGQTNEQKTKEDVIRNAVLAKQKWLVDRELEARLEATTGSTSPSTHGREDRLDQQTPSSARGRATLSSTADSPEPESATGGRYDVQPHARQINELHCTETGLESSSKIHAPCTTPVFGLGIFGASEDNVFSRLKATPHLNDRLTPKHSPSAPPIQVHGSGFTTPATPSHPRSPFGEEPLKVTPRNHPGSPVFQPKRNNSFKRKIEAAADRARELRSIGSHPALRESPSKSSLPPVPNTAPLITLNDIWDFERGEDGRYDSVVKEDELNFDLGNAEVTMESPTFTMESDSAPRKSVFKWDDVDEGYLEQPRHAAGVYEAESNISAVALHDELKHLSEFMSLKYPGRLESDSDDETEYVDNPDYNPAHDVSGESKVLIDDVIAQWESPSTSGSHSPSTKTCCPRAAGLLKASGGYDQLTARATAKLDLRHFHPSATDSRDALLTCAVCSKVVCPKCAKLCIEALCCQVMCKECGRSAEGRCDIH